MKFLAVCVIASIMFGALAAYAVVNLLPKSDNQRIADFYATEHAVSVSPSDFTSDLAKGRLDGLVVDLRAQSAYDAGHLVTAINIPAGSMSESQVVSAFSNLSTEEPVITYCYSEYCMLSRNVGNALAQKGIYVKHMTAGWYEINRDFAPYTVNGTEPGKANATYYPPNFCDPTVQGGFGC